MREPLPHTGEPDEVWAPAFSPAQPQLLRAAGKGSHCWMTLPCIHVCFSLSFCHSVFQVDDNQINIKIHLYDHLGAKSFAIHI